MKFQIVMRDELGQWSTAGSWGSEYATYDTEAEAQDAIRDLKEVCGYANAENAAVMPTTASVFKVLLWAAENVDE